ncbi:MAG TPA: hypothetical protein VGJ26_05215 [Pirellulales bacterium]
MSKRKQRPKQTPSPTSGESQSVEMLTVGWMLSLITGLLCEIGFVLARAYVLFVDPTAGRMEVLASMLLFAAAVLGLFSLALCAVVVKLRKAPPPRGIVVFGIVIGAAPLAALLIGSLRQV